MSKYTVTTYYDIDENITRVLVLESDNPKLSKEITKFEGKITGEENEPDIHVLGDGSILKIAISYTNNNQIFLKHIISGIPNITNNCCYKYEKDYPCKEKPQFVADFALFDDFNRGKCLLAINYDAKKVNDNIFCISELFKVNNSNTIKIISERIQNEVQSSGFGFHEYPEIIDVQCEEIPSFYQPDNPNKKAISMTIRTRYEDPFQLYIEDNNLGLFDTSMYIYDMISHFPTTRKTSKIYLIPHSYLGDGYMNLSEFSLIFPKTKFYEDYVVSYYKSQHGFKTSSKKNRDRLLKERKRSKENK